MQFQADVADVSVERPTDVESTGRGAAMLAGIGAGLFAGLEEVARMSAVGTRFEPQMSPTDRDAHLTRWQRALDRTRSRAR
jgi:glycerol kinase